MRQNGTCPSPQMTAKQRGKNQYVEYLHIRLPCRCFPSSSLPCWPFVGMSHRARPVVLRARSGRWSLVLAWSGCGGRWHWPPHVSSHYAIPHVRISHLNVSFPFTLSSCIFLTLHCHLLLLRVVFAYTLCEASTSWFKWRESLRLLRWTLAIDGVVVCA